MTALQPLPDGTPLAEREPAALIGTITTLATAVLGLVVAFVDVPEEVRTALLVLIAALAPVIAGAIIRGRVTPVRRPPS